MANKNGNPAKKTAEVKSGKDGEKSKQRRIGVEKTRLKKLFADLPETKLKAVQGLIDNAAFLRIQLEDMQADILEKGYVELFTQSDKTEPYERERPAIKLYNNLISRYTDVIVKITGMLPKSEAVQIETDALGDFIKGRA